jgi:tRNA A-37 threonylcarbamoyl transferase component Bud32
MLELEDTQLGHYQLQQRIARGGMSEVYLAYDMDTQAIVALKIVNKLQQDHTQRFLSEVQALKQLAHDHILPVFEYGEDETCCYIAMPYVKDGTLRHRLNEGPLSLTETEALFTQIATALQWSHDHGIVHRDIKPSNVLLQDGTYVYLADFGLAKSFADKHDLTQVGCLIGTPEYMAPELSEEPATSRSDIYALGILLYLMLVGQVPFKGDTPLAIYWKHLQELPQPPSQFNAAISAVVENVILRALEKDPEQRFATVREMAEAFSAAVVEVNAAQAQVEELHLAAPSIRYYAAAHAATHSTLPFALRKLAWSNMFYNRKVHPAYLAFAALLFLFILPLTLGITFSLSGLNTAAPAVLGANVQFTNRFVHLPSTGVTPTVPKTGNQTTGSSTDADKPTGVVPAPFPHGGGNSGGGDKGRGGHGHGHGHGNGHKHGHGGG